MKRPRAVRGEKGAISALVVVLFVFLLILAGLVVDGGNALNARQRAIDDAEQAARVAANQIDIGTLRASGDVVLLPSAGDAARSYLVSIGYSGANVDVNNTGAEVIVQVERTVSTQLLSLAFIPSFTVSGRATARPAVGIDQEM